MKNLKGLFFITVLVFSSGIISGSMAQPASSYTVRRNGPQLDISGEGGICVGASCYDFVNGCNGQKQFHHFRDWNNNTYLPANGVAWPTARPTFSYTFTVNGTYSLNYYVGIAANTGSCNFNGAGCNNGGPLKVSVTIYVEDNLAALNNLPATICKGSSIDLYNYTNKTSGVTFYVDGQPLGGNSFIASNYSTGIHSITAFRAYANGSTDIPIGNISVYDVALTTGNPSSANVCPGGAINFNASGIGTGVSYQWQESTNGGGIWNDLSNAGVYSGVTTQSVSIGNVNGKHGYQYRMRTGNLCNNVVSNAASLNLYSQVQVNSSPGSLTVCPGSPSQFNASASPQNGAVSYQWQYWNGGSWIDLTDGAGQVGTTSSSLTFTGAPNNFRARVRDACGAATENATSSASRVHYSSVVINSHPGNVGVCQGSNASFAVSGIAQNGSLTYQWQWSSDGGVNWQNIGDGQWNPHVTVMSGATTANLKFTNVAIGFNSGRLRCQVRDGCGAATETYSNQALLTVYGNVSVSAHPSNQTICPGANAAYSISGNSVNGSLTYQWQSSTNAGSTYSDLNNSGGYSGVTTATLLLTNVTAGWSGNFGAIRYRCRLRDACGAATEAYTSGATLSLYTQVPFAVQPLSQSVCPGSNANFSATAVAQTGILSFQWQLSTNGGVSYSNLTNAGIYSGTTSSILSLTNVNSSHNSNSYQVVVMDGCGSNNLNTSNPKTLSVYAPPVINMHPANKVICPNSNTSFSVAATPANGALTYKWELSTNAGVSYTAITNNLNYSGATAATLMLSNMPPSANNYRYRVIVRDACGPTNEVISDHGTLSFHSQAAITINPSNAIGCTSSNASFTVTAVGTGLTYQWQESTNNGVSYNNVTNTGIFSGATTSALTLTGLTANYDARRYRVSIMGTCNALLSTHGALTVITPPVITTDPIAKQACQNTQAIFSVAASGNNLTYQWEKSLTGAVNSYSAVQGANLPVLSLNSVAAGDNGVYRCMVNNGCANGAPSIGAALVVNPITLITVQPLDQNICPSASTDFTSGASGTGPLAFQWEISTNNGVSYSLLLDGPEYLGTSSNHLSVVNIAPEMNGYRVRSRVSGNCGAPVTTDAATLIVNSIPPSPATQNVARCGDGPLSATALTENNDPEFNWYVNVNDNIPVYTGSTYDIVNLTTSATYFVSQTVLGCESEKSPITFTRHDPHNTPLGDLLTLCIAQGSYDLEQDIGDPVAKGSAFTWTANGTNFISKNFDPSVGVGNYMVNYDPPTSAKAAPYCYGPATRNITVVNSSAGTGIAFEGSLVSNGNTINSCVGDDPIDLTSLTSAKAGSWSTVQGSGVSFSGNAVVFTPAENTYTAINPNIFRYTLTINGCSASKDLNIFVKDNKQKPIITPDLPTAICPGTKLNLAATVQAPGSYNYEWYKAGQHTPLHSGNTLQHDVNNAEVLEVRSINLPFGCRSDATLLAINTPFSSGQIVPDKIVANVGEGVHFSTDAQATGNSFAWKFGDGFTSIEREPTHFYHQPGEYNVDLTITSNLNCSQSLSFRSIGVVGESPQIITDIDHNIFNVSGISIYPIPARDKLTIESEIQITSVKVFDLQGHEIAINTTSAARDLTLDISSVGAGIYIIRLKTQKGIHIAKLKKI